MSPTTRAARLFDLTGRTALITGSSRGIGRAFASGLAEAGAAVVLHGRDPSALERARAELAASGADVSVASFDVTDPRAVFAGVEALVAERGVPDILVNNVGVQRRGPFHELPTAAWDEVIEANLSSVFHVSRAVTPGMVARGSGKVINVGSIHSALGRETIVPYTASKGGIEMLTKGMAADLARHNIQVNTLSPGFIVTDLNADLRASGDFGPWVERRTPAGRWGQVEDLIGTLIFLAGDASAFVSGQNIFVDGGVTSVV